MSLVSLYGVMDILILAPPTGVDTWACPVPKGGEAIFNLCPRSKPAI